jgi:hypothetical protein
VQIEASFRWQRALISSTTGDLVRALVTTLVLAAALPAFSQRLFVPMDDEQRDHLRAYGLTHWCLEAPRSLTCEWLLNYRAGSFVLPDMAEVRARAEQLGVTVRPLPDAEYQRIVATVERENMEKVVLERAARVAVYVPPENRPWDDAVTLALTYAQIHYDKVWDPDVLQGKLKEYDWLHLHHEDFTGQYGKFWVSFAHQPWYVKQVQTAQQIAKATGFPTVQAEKCAVAKQIREFVRDGGFLFAMCSACDSLEVALAAEGVDIIPPEIDGTPADPSANSKLDFSQTMAFKNFHLELRPTVVEIADIDISPDRGQPISQGDTFELFEFSAKQDPIVTMLTQDHVSRVQDFLGLTTAFRRETLKDNVIVMGEIPQKNAAKYIHGDFGEGTFTYYGGHDPEDYAHVVGEQPTDLSFHKHSPGYRLILNNVLFPAARTKERKT